MYSTINRNKFGDCSQCRAINTDVVKIGRDLFCLSCNRINKAKVQMQKARERTRVRGLIKSENNTELTKINDIVKMEQWFVRMAAVLKAKPYCMECNAWIPAKFYRHASAHIFPKEHFPSVKSHPLNGLILGAGCCHNKTHTIESFKKMKVFPLAVERYKAFKHLITETHKYQTLFEQAMNEALL